MSQLSWSILPGGVAGGSLPDRPSTELNLGPLDTLTYNQRLVQIAFIKLLNVV